VMSLLLFALKSHLVNVFDMKGDSADLIHFFCSYIAVFFIFSGILFVANASFNNLGKAKYSTLFNVGKATLGTVPFVYFGALWGGVYGVLIGQILGSILFGTLGVWVAYRLVDKVAAQAQFSAMANVGGVNAAPRNVALSEEEEIANCVAENLPSATNPLSSSCVQMAQLTEEQESESVLPITYLEEGKKPN
ncbi:MAG TPA: MATE family efflux transporter, partial [Shewanella baltica]|nr:MATE family efflux transporter [Shewanella baltica]